MGVATLTPPAQRIGEELVYPDGRLELADDSAIRNSSLYNADLAPVPIKRRTWTTYNYMALWVGMSHNIPTYLLASGLVLLGMAWYQAILTIAIANIIVLIPMLANSHAGTKYGIPYPVIARAACGDVGANVAAPARAGVDRGGAEGPPEREGGARCRRQTDRRHVRPGRGRDAAEPDQTPARPAGRVRKAVFQGSPTRSGWFLH